MLQRLRRVWTASVRGVDRPQAHDASKARSDALVDPCALARCPLDELQVLLAHTDIVRHAAAIDQGRLATGGDDGRVHIWDRHTGALLATLEGHTGPVTALLLLESQVLLSASADRSVRMWALDGGRRRRRSSNSSSNKAATGSEHNNGDVVTGLKVEAGANVSLSAGGLTTDLDVGAAVDADGGHDRRSNMGGQESATLPPGYVCLRQLSPRHAAAVKCLCPLTAGGRASFVSGGNDDILRVWSRRGQLVSEIKRAEEENLHALLAVNAQRVVTASDSTNLMVYRLDTNGLETTLAFHRESVRCLVRLSATMFASASLDGAIVVWSSDALAPMRILTQPEEYRNEHRVYISAVRGMLQLSDRYLAATIGNGFAIFDVLTGWCVCDGSGAHDAECTALVSLYDGTRLISAGADSTLRMWAFSTPAGAQIASSRRKAGASCALDHLDRAFSWRQAPPPLSVQEETQLKQQQQTLSSAQGQQHDSQASSSIQPSSPAPISRTSLDPSDAVPALPIFGTPPSQTITPKGIEPLGPASDRQRSPVLVGEMSGHSRSVEALLPLAETSLASCGTDHMVLLWKDGGAESELRNHFASAFVQEQYHRRIEEAVQEALEDSLPVLREESMNRVADSSSVGGELTRWHDVVRQLDF